MWKEFKAFAMRGNVLDMAVGIIIGTAFGAIVKSLVSDIIMPPLVYWWGGLTFPACSSSCTRALPLVHMRQSPRPKKLVLSPSITGSLSTPSSTFSL